MKFTEIERLQLEAMGYEIAVNEDGDEIAKLCRGSVANYRKSTIYAGWTCVDYDGEVYYLDEY